MESQDNPGGFLPVNLSKVLLQPQELITTLRHIGIGVEHDHMCVRGVERVVKLAGGPAVLIRHVKSRQISEKLLLWLDVAGVRGIGGALGVDFRSLCRGQRANTWAHNKILID